MKNFRTEFNTAYDSLIKCEDGYTYQFEYEDSRIFYEEFEGYFCLLDSKADLEAMKIKDHNYYSYCLICLN